MRGIVGYGAYVPYNRLARAAISASLSAGGGKGSRAVASYDEDPTSMAVEAARNLFRSADHPRPSQIWFATATPPYLDKTNATAIHAALNMPSSVFAADMTGSSRSATGAMLAALQGSVPTLVCASDVRTGRPSSSDEANTGDAAMALLIGSDDDAPLLAEWLGGASATAEFLDRWREPGWRYSRVWEERFGEQAYLPLVAEAANAGLKDATMEPDDVDRVIITGLHARAVRGAAGAAGIDGDKVGDNLAATVGATGSAHDGLLLADALDKATPGEIIMIVSLADGCDVNIFRATDAIADHTPFRSVGRQIADGNDGLAYATFLTWRGMLDREPPRRPDPTPPAAPPSFRMNDWKYGFNGSRDLSSGMIHMPPMRVSLKGGAVDEMELVPMADKLATVATYTIDHLAYSPSPPVIAAVIDFDGGGRFNCQITDADPDEIEIGSRVEMSFRRLLTADGVHNYFWKAKPVR